MAALFKLEAAWDKKGDSPFHLFGQVDGSVAHERLFRRVPASPDWKTPFLPIVAERGSADVFLDTFGYFVFTPHARTRLASFVDDWVEWLPVEADLVGSCFILNPLHHMALGADAAFRQNEVSRNITVVYRYSSDFPSGTIPPIFGVRQHHESAADRAGSALNQILATNQVASVSLRGVRWKKVLN